ncbi:hypothetical protein [Chitiniphilus eburneus]|uniref:MGDG synthase family glycosyltransferase n=1 Tax=Chitiniphilus eburneus TaxID=2571148 RepID=UPI0035CEF6F3
MSQPLLLLHAIAGAGHTRATHAVSAVLGQGGDTDHRVVDMLDCATALLRKRYTQANIDLVQRMSALWGCFHDRADQVKPESKSARKRLAFNKINRRAFKHLLAEIAPSGIARPHFLPLELLSNLKSRGKLAAVPAVSSDVSLYGFWVCPHIDHHHVATPDGARELQRKGVDAARLARPDAACAVTDRLLAAVGR